MKTPGIKWAMHCRFLEARGIDRDLGSNVLAAKRSLRTAGALPFDRVNALDRGLTVAFASPSSIADTSHPSA